MRPCNIVIQPSHWSTLDLHATRFTRQVAAERAALSRLETQRRRLLDAHLAGAVSLDLFSEKQATLSQKLAATQAKLAAVERSNESALSGLALARKLLHKAGAAYTDADPITQRAWNQAFFTRLFVRPSPDGEPQVVGAQLTDPFATLLSDKAAAAAARLAKRRPAALADGVRTLRK